MAGAVYESALEGFSAQVSLETQPGFFRRRARERGKHEKSVVFEVRSIFSRLVAIVLGRELGHVMNFRRALKRYISSTRNG